ncbi:hypothetical protein DM860_009903 [Cuscuta australis]|uniref:Uncharacterized protein n=1 Tax=Cuscuta australis TaxID=267555 RepID=A0A328DFW0_9ASTE|nr:hypothetical protein DM860_009903 [Cuscuta australis]
MFQDEGSSSSVTSSSPLQAFQMAAPPPPDPWPKELKSEERGLYLIHLLLTCAGHVAAGSVESANAVLDQISDLASPCGDTMQRIACYFAGALADRVLRHLPGVHRALRATDLVSPAEYFLARKVFDELFPFSKVSFLVANQAILEAMEGEKMVHIIDFNTADPAPWRAILRDFSTRPEGPPHLRLTGVHPVRDVVEQTGRVLVDEAEKLDIPFQFSSIVTKFENLDLDRVRVKTGEALVISSVLQFHTLLAPHENIIPSDQATLGEPTEKDSENSTSSALTFSSINEIEPFLNYLSGLSPKVMVITEQESDHNGPSLMERLSESLYFYATLFDCIESTLPRSSLDRARLENMVLGEEISNIIAEEGVERKERHEKLPKWFRRFESTGFYNVPLSYYAMTRGKRFLESVGRDGYKMKEENGCAVICWHDRPLYSVSAWRCGR